MINKDIKDSPSAAEDAAIATIESMAIKRIKAGNRSQQAPFSYLKKYIALLKKYGKKLKVS